MLRRYAALALFLVFVFPPNAIFAQQPAQTPSSQPPVRAQQPGQQTPAKDPNDPIERIKDEGMNRSQVMQTLSYLTDVIGPRLTNSPGMKRANEWTRDQMANVGVAERPSRSMGAIWTGLEAKAIFRASG